MKPGYKQTEVGVIPEEWETRHLMDISRKITDGDHATPQRESHGYYLLSARNVLNGRIDVSDVDYVGAAEYQRMKQRCGPETGDILISCSGTIGRVAIVPRDFECVLVRSAALAKIERELADSTFLQFWLQSSKAQGQIASSVNQGAQPNLFLNHIERLACPHPPLTEQRAIATALSDVDGLLGALDRLIAKKRDLKQAAMQQLLTGQTRLPGFHGEWEVKTFGEVFDYMPTATNSRSDLNDAGDTYYIHYGDIHTRFHNHLDFRTTQPPRINRSLCRNAALLKNGDWVMADASEDYDGVGKTIEVQGLEEDTNAIAGLHTFVLRQKTSTYAPGFKGHLGNLKSLHEQFLRVATGMKVYGVSKTALKALELPIPELAEQTAIAEVLSEMDAELAGLEQRREKTRALKQGMMQELLTGKTRLI